MLFNDQLVVVRGGGDIATGVVWRLTRAGFPVIVCELAVPLAVRRTVALSSAIDDGRVVVEGMVGLRVDVADREAMNELVSTALTGVVPVIVSPGLPDLSGAVASVLVDARLAKVNIDTTIDDASTVIGLGPGFTAGVDCHAVIETMRGHHLGKVIWDGAAAPDTGTPGIVGGRGSGRVLRAPCDGPVSWMTRIGDRVVHGDVLGTVADLPVFAPFDGVVRGLISPSVDVTTGLKIGDVDPRADPSTCFEISDKALSVGGGVVEAVLSRMSRPADSRGGI